jgi:serine/threonine-protein kinase
VSTDSAARYVPPDWLLYVRQGALVARRFDVKRGSVAEEAIPIAEGIPLGGIVGGAVVFPAISVSAQGIIAYRTAATVRRQLTWFDRTGNLLGTIGQPDDALRAPDLSPDETKVAVDREVQGNRDIYVIDAVHAPRLTFDPALDVFPLWSPDGNRIAFTSSRANARSLFIKASTGAGPDDALVQLSPQLEVNAVTSWSHDGNFLLADVTPVDVCVLPLTGDRNPYPFLNSTASERLAQFSPDSRWVAYQSNESGGRAEIYIRPFTGPGGPWQVSTGGGAQPRWAKSGNELYFIAPDGGLMAASIVENGNSIEHGTPVKLFQTHIYLGGVDQPMRGQYNVAKDGRFLIDTVVDERPAPPIIVLQNWRPK